MFPVNFVTHVPGCTRGLTSGVSSNKDLTMAVSRMRGLNRMFGRGDEIV
jgi:hypothetical protein